ncbi:hypothetical protein VQH23_09635 [Pararoseomonas sp. SCSIO 73927]|uniref:hypothetical protein n=1 Tax=Pararoseomonas sp. SCSIO 73927 TaxID=3114537 RepID=UPI0030CFAF6E
MAAANERWWANSFLRMEAEGYQYDRGRGDWAKIEDPNPDPLKRNPRGLFARNGGLMVKRRLVLAQDNVMYRFAALAYARRGVWTKAERLAPLLNSPWWMEEDRMFLLLSRARQAGVGLVEMARRQLALPQEWTDADVIVRVRIRPGILLAAHAGPGLTAEGGGERRVIAPEAPHLLIDQLYVPGLGRHPALGSAGAGNAAAWFDAGTAVAFDPNIRGLNP